MKFPKLLMFAVLAISLSSCTTRLVDFTTISTKNVDLGVDRSQGKRTEGKATYFLGFGFNLKDAIDKALENAGTEYDLLIDGVVRYSSYPFITVVKVEGVAVSSRTLSSSMTEEEFEEWCKSQNIMDPYNVLKSSEAAN